jgi:hypothetical protein
MKFIFPQNFNTSSKLLGFIDYTTILVNIIWGLFIFLIIYFTISNTTLKICMFIIFFFPILLISIIGFNHEKISYVVKYLFFYIKRPKLYLYRKY